MYRVSVILIFSLMFFNSAKSQVEDRLRALDESQVNQFIEPLSTAIGLAFNSGTFNTAKIPSEFSLSVGITTPFILIPESETTFKPDLPEGYNNSLPTATIFGNEGGYYAGPEGYIVYPPGINRTTIPAVLTHASLSFAGTRLLLRFVPPLDVGETSLSMYGLGLSHSISRYFTALPFDLAIQGLYSQLNVKDIADHINYAFNVHGSKEFGVFTLYSGVQYERSSMDLSYTFRINDPTDPDNFIEREITANLDGENAFRFTVGGSLKLLIFRLSTDISAGRFFTLTSGLSIEI